MLQAGSLEIAYSLGKSQCIHVCFFILRITFNSFAWELCYTYFVNPGKLHFLSVKAQVRVSFPVDGKRTHVTTPYIVTLKTTDAACTLCTYRGLMGRTRK